MASYSLKVAYSLTNYYEEIVEVEADSLEEARELVYNDDLETDLQLESPVASDIKIDSVLEV